MNLSIIVIMILYVYYFIYKNHQSDSDEFKDFNPNTERIYRKCSSCFIYSFDLVKAACNHFYCTDCYENIIKAQLDANVSKNVYCPMCSKTISKNILYQHTNRNLVSRIINKNIEEVQWFICRFCLNETAAENGITLNCNHRYCCACILKHVERLIENSKVSVFDFVCPGCPTAISIEQVKSFLSKEYYEKYLNLVIKNYKPQEKDLILKQCIYCGVYIEIPDKLEELRCPSCLNLYSLKCNNKHQNMTCEDFILKTKDEEKFLSKYLVCPNCLNEVNKDNDCNYLICSCKTRFCSICGKELKGNGYSAHFKKEGPFGKTCNTLDNIIDEL